MKSQDLRHRFYPLASTICGALVTAGLCTTGVAQVVLAVVGAGIWIWETIVATRYSSPTQYTVEPVTGDAVEGMASDPGVVA